MKKLFLFAIPFTYLLILLFRAEQAFTQDLGRHLLLGEMILDCFCIPITNTFSYTFPDFSFVNHHWAAEVIFFLIVKFWDLYSLLIFKTLIIFIAFLLIFSLAVKRGGIFLASAWSVPFLFTFSERFDLRPEIFSFLYLSVSLYLLFQYLKTKSYHYLLPLPLIQMLWVNSHIYFFVLLVLYGFLFLDQLYNRSVTKQFVIVGLLLVGATLLNPHGISGALYPFQVFDNYGYSIVENQNIFFLNGFFFNPRILVFEIMAIVTLVSLFIHIKKKNVFESLCLVFAVVAGSIMIRNFPIFVFVAFPSTVAALSSIINNQSPILKKQIRGALIGGSLFFFLIGSFKMISSPNWGLQYVYGAENAVDFFEKNTISGNIFNNFDIGSYLIYRLYPTHRVFVDGRPEAYPAEFFELYKNMQTDPKLFEQQVIRYDINTIFFANTDMTPWAQQFLQNIVFNPAWKVIYLDERIIILVRNRPENALIIEQYSVQLPKK